MAETSENTAALSPVEQEDSNTEPVREEISLPQEFEKNLDISQGVGLLGCSASGETDSREKTEQEGRQQDDRQQDGQTVSAPASEPSSESKTLRPDAALQTQRPDCQDWRSGSRCRAVYSGDGLVYPAVILWVKGQRCRVRYDDYNNEEEQDVSSLLKIDEFIGPSRSAAAKSSSRKTGVEKPVERGAERRSAWRDDQYPSAWTRERGYQSKTEREEKKKDGDRAKNHSFPFFPPVPPLLQSNSGDSQSFVPPPPPPSSWAGGGKESAGVDSASNMLMLWYMCGFHTGSYLAQQAFKSSPKD